MPRVIVIDDEPLARLRLRQLLAAHPAVDLVGEASSAAEGRALVERTRPDAIFLDVELTDASGFDLIAALDPPPRVVFVTAHATYATEAFAVDAVDYLVKPVRPERLAVALQRVERAEPRGLASPKASDGSLLRLRTPGRLVSVQVDSIAAVEAERDYARVHTADAPSIFTNHPLAFYDAQLPRPPFLRVGRSLLIHGGRLRDVRRVSRDETRISLDGLAAPLTLGRAAAVALRAALSASGPALPRSNVGADD
jgi:two-component system LytT family response regulator